MDAQREGDEGPEGHRRKDYDGPPREVGVAVDGLKEGLGPLEDGVRTGAGGWERFAAVASVGREGHSWDGRARLEGEKEGSEGRLLRRRRRRRIEATHTYTPYERNS